MNFTESDIEAMLSRRPAEKASEAVLRPGSAIGRWRIEAFLGSGRTAEVYRVVDVKSARHGALKLLVDETGIVEEKFFAEIGILRKLDISAVPRFFEQGDFDGRPYFVMEYLLPATFPPERGEAASVNISLAKAVAKLHNAGYVHRDIKPSNVLMRKNGEIVVADLGLAVPDGAGSAGILKDGGFAVGTPGFSAPEQLIDGKWGKRADVFSLGKILKASYSGRLPRRFAVAARKATEESPEDRYPDAAAYARALEGVSRMRKALFASLLVVTAVAAWAIFTWKPSAGAGGNSALDGFVSTPAFRPGEGRVPSGEHARKPGEDDAGYFVRVLSLARRGDVEAQNAVAEAYFQGRGVDKDAVKAVEWYAKAAEKGHVPSIASLGYCTLHGIGCDKDPQKAFIWFLSAAESGYHAAMSDVAWCYINGSGTEKDPFRGFHWALRAAEKGHVPAQAMAGECYLLGWGVERDVEKARQWLSKAAAGGSRRAAELLCGIPDGI